MKKILIISLIGLGYEGMTSVIYNYTYNMNRENLQLEFIADKSIPESLRNRFQEIGIVHLIPNRKNEFRKYLKALRKLIRAEHFDVVHIHGNSGTMAIEAFLARMQGIKKVIVHAHSTACNYPKLNKLLTPIMKVFATDYVACSRTAGQWLYKKTDYIVFSNAINIRKFSFDNCIRSQYRQESGIGDRWCIGHIGHFSRVKNHDFLLDVFYEFHKIDSNCVLLLGGAGPLLENIKNKVHQLGLDGNVIFTGCRNDVERLYQAMDIFVFPSLWEGLGMALIEAQAAGLPALVSTEVPLEAKCLSRVEYFNLSFGASEWAKKIKCIKEQKWKRDIDVYEEIAKCRFDIHTEADHLRELYLK